jgi:hypothetical protein
MTEQAKGIWTFLFILVAVELRFYLLYYPIAFYNYLVPPGDDAANHYVMIENILKGKFDTSYPWLFHYIIATISRIGGWSVIDVLRYLTPALVILPSIAIYIFLKQTFNRTTALIGFVICLWASNYGLVAYGDGNYPNIIAAGFLMPLAMLYLLRSLKERKLSNYIWTMVLTLLIMLTHHLSAIYMIAVVPIYLIALGIWNKCEKLAVNYKRAMIYLGIVFAAVVGFVALLPIKQVFVAAFASITGSGSFSAGANFTKPIEFGDYASQIGSLAFYGGLIGLLYLIYLLGEPKEKVNKSAILMVLIWFVVIFVLSRLSQTGLPGRFAREAAVPLIMSLAISIGYFISMMRSNLQKSLATLFFGLIIFINLVQVNAGQYMAPDFFNRMIWFSEQDKRAVDAIVKFTPKDAIILANPTTPYLPIFAEREIRFNVPPQVKIPSGVRDYAAQANIHFLFIGKKTPSNPDDKTYPFFADFDKRTDLLKAAIVGCGPISDKDETFAIYDLDKCKVKAKK